MATVQDFINTWKTGEVRGANQVNNTVALNRFNRWLHIFQKELLEYVANQMQVATVVLPTEVGKSDYELPFAFTWLGLTTDFYSVAQLRVAYEEKNGSPAYRVCEPISIADYNITAKGKSKWEPIIMRRIGKLSPRYSFITDKVGDKAVSKIRIYPTPTKAIAGGLSLTFNYIDRPLQINTDLDKIQLPWYFMDAIEDYMTYKLMDIENPEIAMTYFQLFKETLHNNIYWLNRDQRPVEEEMADLSYYSHN